MSITAGEGHNQTANAMKAYFQEKNVRCEVLDTYGYISKEFADFINKGYLFTSSKTKPLYKGTYRLLEKRKSDSFHFSSTRLLNHVFIKETREYICGFDPDAIIFTHPFVGIILDILKQKNELNIPTTGILTDFKFHPYWEEALRNNYVIVPNEMLIYQSIEKGFKPSQIIPTGIPINPKFAVSVSKETARKKLGLDPAKHTLLVMAGSMGYGKMADNILKLDSLDSSVDFQIISVCGNNAAMKEKIDSLKTERTVLNFGFATNVDLLMDAADCIVSKPGGLTTSEALAKKLPMLIVDPIPGQEQRNTEFLLNHGAAMAASQTTPLTELVYQVFTSPTRLQIMRNAISEIAKPNSTRDACEFVMSLVADKEKTSIPEMIEI